MDRKNLPHLASAVEKRVIPAVNGLYNFLNHDHAITKPQEHQWHEITSVSTVASTYFQSANNYADFNIPNDINGSLDWMHLLITCSNSHGANDWVSSCSVPYFFNRIEVRQNGNIIETLRADEIYLTQTAFKDHVALEKDEVDTGIDPTSFEADTTTLTIQELDATATFRLPLRCVLNACGIPLMAVDGQLSLRVYSQAVSVFSASAQNANLGLSTLRLWCREVKPHPHGMDALKRSARIPLDFRYSQWAHEQASLSLTSGSTTKYITNNFDNDLASLVFVLIRASGATTTGLEDFLSANNVYLEDASNKNLHNGIQWSADDLKHLFKRAFPNNMINATNKNTYCLVASEDPVKALHNGSQNGFMALPKNCKVVINASATATRQLDVYALLYKHVRVEQGKIKIY